MKLTFLGTGTSQGVPVIGCDCDVCRSDNPRNKRLRTSALLDVKGTSILIDVGPDFRIQALQANIRHIDAVVLTHQHFDHIGGLDDLRPFTERQGVLPVYGSASTLDDTSHRFSYVFNGGSQGSSCPRLELMPVAAPFHIGDTEIVPFEVMHGTWVIYAYRIGSLAYITDASAIPAESMEFLQGLDVLVLNALRYKPHPTHFSLDEALEVVQKIQPKKTFLVHTTHAFEYRKTNADLPAGVELAYDGLQLTIEDPS